MKIRKILMLFVAISFSLLVAACSQESSQSESSTSSALSDQSEPSAELPVKSEDEIIAELSMREDFFSLFDQHCVDPNGVFVGSNYKIEEATITRRKIDEAAETDDVYITVTSDNDGSTHIGEFHLRYTFYDVGGWYLDSIEMESSQIKPSTQVSDMEAYNIALQILSPMGASTTDSYIDSHLTVSDEEEIVKVAVDFNDGILDIDGVLDLYFRHNGQYWEYTGLYTTNLTYDILIDGTYEDNRETSHHDYMVLTHENSVPTVRFGNTWDHGVDGLNVQDWEFNCLTRCYEEWGGLDGSVFVRYYFAPNGTIHYYIGDHLYSVFHRITDPITDREVLWDYLVSTGKAP